MLVCLFSYFNLGFVCLFVLNERIFYAEVLYEFSKVGVFCTVYIYCIMQTEPNFLKN